MKITLYQNGGSLHAADDAAKNFLRRLGDGEFMVIDAKRSRNVQHHRKLFALLQIVLENQERFRTVDELLDFFKIATGYCETLVFAGREYVKPKSIAFESMGQDEFERFFDAVCDLIAKHILPTVTQPILEREIRDLIGA